MNVYGIGSALGGIRLPEGSPRPQVEQQRGPASPAAPPPPVAPRPAQGVGQSSNALPAEPPPGTDPELWSVLSAEERTFFARVGAMGPLTYGRMLNEGAAPVARGVRLDVRA